MKAWTRWQDWVNVVLGVWLVVSTWIFGYAGSAAGYNAWALGALIAVTGLWSLYRPASRAGEGLNIALGTWTFFAPWVFAFAWAMSSAAWNAWIVGAAVAIIAVLALPRVATVFRPHA